MADVLVLGGGFGGLAAANELRAILPDDDTITLVAAQDHFYMGFAKLWDLGRIRPLEEGTASLAGLERRGIRYVKATIEEIDADDRTVATSAGTLRADGMVVALGAGDKPEHAAWFGEGVHNLYDGASLPTMRSQLGSLEENMIVLVVIMGGPFKCPPAPYEAALVVRELFRARGDDDIQVKIATPQPMTLPAAGPDASRYVAATLADHGIEMFEEHGLVDIDRGGHVARFANGAEVPYDILLGVPAAAPPTVVASSVLAGKDGWIEPDRHTLRAGVDRVYAVGDCTAIPTATGQLPKAGVFAEREGIVAARNLAAELNGGASLEFDGHGACFLEFPERKVAVVEGDFYATPRPDVEITPASDAGFARKLDYEHSRLLAWLR